MGSTQNRGVSRRLVLGSSAVLGAGMAASALPAAADDKASNADGFSSAHHGGGPSVRAAVRFLQRVTDAYRSSGPRLAQSYYDGAFPDQPENGLRNDVAFVYDNALTIIALLAGGDTKRAKALGDGLIYAQQNDPEKDFRDAGRLRQAYRADGFTTSDGKVDLLPEYGFLGTAVGDMAWPGVALAQLAKATGQRRYLDAALKIADWILTRKSDTGLGGYTFGEGQTTDLSDNVSTEHNIDVYAFFRLLAKLTRNDDWYDLADHAWDFVERVWNAEDRFYWTGSDEGVEINKNPLQLPEDVQSWGYLARATRRTSASLDWAYGNLASTDTPLRQNSKLTGNQRVTGAVFSSGTLLTDPKVTIGGGQYNPYPDPAGVWFEGTGQLGLALRLRDRGDRCAGALLSALAWAQRELGDDQTFGGKRIEGGIVAASSPIDTGFGFGYYQHLHTAATSWAVFAATRTNPYVFGKR